MHYSSVQFGIGLLLKRGYPVTLLSSDRRVPTVRRPLFLMLLATAVIFAFLRYLNLGSDFPSDITQAGVIYTDEGWYSNAATRQVVRGNWYLAGDFNPAVNLPVGQILYSILFSLAGQSSLVTARLVSASAFVVQTVLLFLFLKDRFDKITAALAAVVMTTNYMAFAYSRLAVMEPVFTCLIMAAITVGASARTGHPVRRTLLSSALLSAAILTKTSAVFAIPVVAYTSYRSSQKPRSGWSLAALSLASVLFTVGGYSLFAQARYPADYAYFLAINLQHRSYSSLVDFFVEVPHKLLAIQAFGKGLVALTLVGLCTSLALSRPLRREPALHIMLLWPLFLLSMLISVAYYPPRYYFPLIIPLAALCSISCMELTRRLRETRFVALPLMLMAVITLSGARQICVYLASRSYSFLNMATGVHRVIEERKEDPGKTTILGNVADSVALEIDVRAINSLQGTRDLQWKLRQYQPGYFLMHSDEEVLSEIQTACQTRELAHWDVFGNRYAQGQPVTLLSPSCNF